MHNIAYKNLAEPMKATVVCAKITINAFSKTRNLAIRPFTVQVTHNGKLESKE